MIELDDVAEAVARGTGPERIVEGEQPGLRHFVDDAAGPALEALAEAGAGARRAGLVHRERKRRAVALAERGLDRVGQTRREASGPTLMRSTITASESTGPSSPRCAASSSSVTVRPSTRAGRTPAGAGRRAACQRIGGPRAGAVLVPARAAVGRPRPPVVVEAVRVASAAAAPSRRTHRSVEPDQQPRARREALEIARDQFGRFPHRPPGRTAGRPSGRPAPRAGGGSRGSRWSCRPWNAGCGCCSSGGWRWPARSPRSRRRPASPSARGTAARRPTGTRRSGAAPRRRWCRRRATTSPTRSPR